MSQHQNLLHLTHQLRWLTKQLFSRSYARLCLFLKGLLLVLSVFFAVSAFATEPAEPIYAEYPMIDYGTGATAERVKRGEYLVKAGDCIACHTIQGGKPFAGGLAVKTPFGTIYSPNITPDKETGIGNWSDHDFDQAMRQGISPAGHYLFPVFPYTFYNKLSTQDVLDIKAYLDKLTPVRQKTPPLDMKWPFNIRLLQSFWRFMFFDFKKGEFVPNRRQSEEWNRGAYLVEGLGHCVMCHTPVNALGAWKREYDLTGGFVDGYRAPNISATRLKDVSTEKVLDVFLRDISLQGGKIQGPMLEANHDSLRHLKVEDLRAMVTYLKTVKSKTPPSPLTGGGEKAGQTIYDQYCSGCHNMGGGGAPKLGDSNAWASRISSGGISQIYDKAIKGIGGMPPKGNCDSCSTEQIKAAVDYILKSSEGKKGAATPAPVLQSLTSLTKGKQVYEKVCTVCHQAGQLGAPRLGDQKAWEPLLKQNLDVLAEHAINGYKGHPPMGACYQCSDADIISAVKYMSQEGGHGKDYRLW